MRRRLGTTFLALLLVAGTSATAAGPAAAQDIGESTTIERRPVVFVHGGAGSGAQFESQAMRFTSNGYPAARIRVLEYNSVSPGTFGVIPAQLDALIAELQAETGAAQIDLLGHSLGTGLMQGYLSDPVRAARVAHYVNIDGSQAAAPPGGVPTLALWARGSPTRRIVGATNVYIPDQSHVQIATSRESFGAMFRFFNDGEEPATVDILPEPSGKPEISGRAVNFPANSGVTDATLEIFEVDPTSGSRLAAAAEASFALDGDGSWGPFEGVVGKSYEFAIVRDGSVHHLYTQPLTRSDHLVRLNSSPPGEGIGALIERGDGHTAIVISRYKEWWGNHPTQSDTLEIDGTNVLSAATAPVTKNAIGLFSFDVGSDGVSNLAVPIPTLFGLPFLTGVDQYIPAANPPDRTVSVVNAPRGDTSNLQVVNVPNWASSLHGVSVVFNDFAQPATGATFTARLSAEACVSLGAIAAAGGTSSADVIRFGVDVLHQVALAGGAIPPPTPGPNEGPCEVVVSWSDDDLELVEDTAAAWGVAPDYLHHGSARLILAIVWILHGLST